MNHHFFVIQIGLDYYWTFSGPDLHTGTIKVSNLAQAHRFDTSVGAQTTANLINGNPSTHPHAQAIVKKCGIIG